MRKSSLYAMALVVSAFIGYVAVKSMADSFKDIDFNFEDDDEEETF